MHVKVIAHGKMSDQQLHRLQSTSSFEMRRKASFSKLHGSICRATHGMYEDIKPTSSKYDIWQLMDKYLDSDKDTIQRGIVNHAEYTLAKNRFNIDNESCYRATAYSIRDRLLEVFNDTNQFFFAKDVKRCYYLSLEFLIGRAMQNALVNLDIEDEYKVALQEMGFALEGLYEYEHDAALGNGGLGRLAACFLDSMATLNYPCWGYGIRYTYGIFEQQLVNGWQVEYPDYWLVQDNPWEICRQDVTYAVRFNGFVKEWTDADGHYHTKWQGGQIIQAVAYDNLIPGFDSYNCINLRLWRAVPSKEFDFQCFNQGRYLEAIKDRQDAECISAVLYPNDATDEGKILRLKQQYFFVCATIQDILRRYTKRGDRNWNDLPKKMAVQLNDTHPTIGIPELIRILVDVENIEWERAVSITREVFHYTNHTVLPEALEKWSSHMLEKLLPRHVRIINEMNFRFLSGVEIQWRGQIDRIANMSVYEDGGGMKMIRMANLAVIGCDKVNGVAAIHTGLIKTELFKDFNDWFPNKFLNITNGVTPRRWIHNSNRKLSMLLSNWLGSDAWLKNAKMCKSLLDEIENDKMIEEWKLVKLYNKKRFCDWLENHGGPKGINPEKMLFDIQVKRIHEYKRQHLNALYMVHRYLTIKNMSVSERREKVVPRATFVGGKAAPGYVRAKTIIKLINLIADLVNNDPDMNEYFKVFFLPNYNVSSAQVIIPAADINQQISTAGMEASGTGNMKFVMNGSLIIGTMDGATVEIVEECGIDTAFIFGAELKEVEPLRKNMRDKKYPIDQHLCDVFGFIQSGGLVSHGHSCGRDDLLEAQRQICGMIEGLLANGGGKMGDYYLLAHDFPSYVDANQRVDDLYKHNPRKWWQMSIKAAANMGTFSTDRTIKEYAEKVWNIEPAERPTPEERKPKLPSPPHRQFT